MKEEKHYRLVNKYRHLIDIIEKHKIVISSTLPVCPHWTYMLLKVGEKDAVTLGNYAALHKKSTTTIDRNL